jgi:hypothetical protein
MKSLKYLLPLSLLAVAGIFCRAESSGFPGLNLGFEEATCEGHASHWVAGSAYLVDPDSYTATLDEVVKHSGKRSMHLKYMMPGSFGVAAASLPIDGLRGNTVELSGWIKTANVTAFAGLWLRVDGATRPALAFNNMRDSTFTGTHDWTHFVFQLPVSDSAAHIYFGAVLGGEGDAWFDDLDIRTIKGIATKIE